MITAFWRTVRFQVVHPSYVVGCTWKQLMAMPVIWQRR